MGGVDHRLSRRTRRAYRRFQIRPEPAGRPAHRSAEDSPWRRHRTVCWADDGCDQCGAPGLGPLRTRGGGDLRRTIRERDRARHHRPFASNISRMQEVLNVSALLWAPGVRYRAQHAREYGYRAGTGLHPLPEPDMLIEPGQVSTLPSGEVTVLTTGARGSRSPRCA